MGKTVEQTILKPNNMLANSPMKVSNGEYPQSSSKSLDQVCSKTAGKPMVLGILILRNQSSWLVAGSSILKILWLNHPQALYDVASIPIYFMVEHGKTISSTK